MKHLILICILSFVHHPAFAQDGKALYAIHCAQCHGPDLRGGNAPSMVDGIWKYGDGRGYRIRNIKNGLTELGMPGYEKQLTNRQITMIVDFIEQMEKEVGQPKPPPPDFVQTLDYDINVDIWVPGPANPLGNRLHRPSNSTHYRTSRHTANGKKRTTPRPRFGNAPGGSRRTGRINGRGNRPELR